LTLRERLGAHILLVLASRDLLVLGDLFHVEHRVPTEHTEDSEDGPFD
jgi:hypothetical protein